MEALYINIQKHLISFNDISDFGRFRNSNPALHTIYI